jgi:hypothetical protein
MKKIIALVSLLVTAAACTAPTETTNRTAPANANMAAETKSAPAMTEADAIAKEKAVWDSFKNKDYDGFVNMLASESIYVSSDGVHDKAAIDTSIRNFAPTDVTFSDWKYLAVDKDAFVITYSATVKAKMDGKDMPPETVRASSAWVNRDGKWLSIYHQDCPVKTMPAPAPPAAAKKPAPATSPAAAPAAVVTGPDAEANEKAIWEALKNKNFDGFASVLAPESIEVEPNGVFDKAGSVKMVSQFDFSKDTLSEFKTIKFDDDASLVTYLVKGPGTTPNGERHSTIWANRGGKWMALFHHGTPAIPAPPPPKAGASPAMKPAASPKAGATPATKPKVSPK